MDRRLIFKGRKISLFLAEERLPNGRTVQREVVEHPGAVVVLPILPDGRVLLENHYRFAVGGNLIEAVAGTLQPGEDPVECAKRELLEETGFVAEEIVHLGDFYSSPGVMTELMRAFVAKGLRKAERRLEDDEILEPFEVPFDEAVKWARCGKIKDAKTIAVLFLALDHRGKE